MASDSTTLSTFRYALQTPTGETMEGVIRAADIDAAQDALEDAKLKVIAIEKETEPRRKALRGVEFFAFNQQLAQLTQAGLPVESGLRLIAQDMRSGRMSASIRAVADELDAGVALPEAFERHRKHFPATYGRLIEAGIASNRLPLALMNLSRHLEMMQRLRAAIWQATAYPAVVAVFFLGVLAFLGLVVIPQFGEMYEDFDTATPAMTLAFLHLAKYTLHVVIAVAALMIFFPVLSLILRLNGQGGWLRDYLLIKLPLIGPAIHRNLMARWCDMMGVGVSAGMNLPEALMLASDVAGSQRLRRDSMRLSEALLSGQGLDESAALEIVPASVPASMRVAAENADLAALLSDLSVMYEHQSDMRLKAIQVFLSPLLLIVMAATIGTTVVAMFLPFLRLMQAVM